MADQRIQYTEKMVGNGHPTLSDTLNRLTLVGHNSDGSHKGYVEALQEGSFAATLAATPTTIQIVVTTEIEVAGPLTISHPLEIKPGGMLVVTSGTVTLAGPFSCGLFQCFNGAGSVTGLTEARPEWFGVDGVDDTSAFTKAIISTKKLLLSARTYYTNFSIPQGFILEGSGVNTTTICPYDVNVPILTIQSMAPYVDNLGVTVRELTIDGLITEGTDTTAFGTQHGIHIDGGNGTSESTSINQILLQHVKVWRCAGHGIFFDGITQATIEYDQVAWWKIDNCVIQWNRGNGVRCEGFAYQGHITGASLIEKNARGITSVVSTNAANPKAQVFITKDSDDANNAYPNAITIDGSTTIQSTYAYYITSNQYTDLSTAGVCGVSIFAARNITISDCYFEGNSYHTYIRGNGVPRNIHVRANYLHQAAVAAVDSYDHGQGLTISSNYMINEGDFASHGIGTNCLGSTVLNCEYLNLEYNVYTGFATSRTLPTFGTGRYITYNFDQDGGDVSGALTYAIGINFTFSRATIQSVTLTGNVTSSTFSQARTNNEYTVFISQDGTGGRTFVWPASGIKWSTGSAPTITATASKKDMFKFLYDGTNYIEIQRLQNMPV